MPRASYEAILRQVRRVYCLLDERPRSAADLASELGCARKIVYRHLRRLRETYGVETKYDERAFVWRITKEPPKPVRRMLFGPEE